MAKPTLDAWLKTSVQEPLRDITGNLALREHALRLSCVNTTYHGAESRSSIMEVIRWSFAALGHLT